MPAELAHLVGRHFVWCRALAPARTAAVASVSAFWVACQELFALQRQQVDDRQKPADC